MVKARLNGLELVSPVQVDDGNIHKVTLTRKGDSLVLAVDNANPATGVVQNLDGDMLSTKDVFLGELLATQNPLSYQDFFFFHDKAI